MSTTNNVPECANWAIWEGPEVEGNANLGAVTLFVRKGMHFPCYITEHTKRIWICKEMLSSMETSEGRSTITALRVMRPDIRWAFEIPYELVTRFSGMRAFGELFIKIDLNGFIQNGDVLCVGRPYNDEFFTKGVSTNKVCPADYAHDVVREVLQ